MREWAQFRWGLVPDLANYAKGGAKLMNAIGLATTVGWAESLAFASGCNSWVFPASALELGAEAVSNDGLFVSQDSSRRPAFSNQFLTN